MEDDNSKDGAALAALPPLREVIAAHGLLADKRLGQHFLLDLNLTRRIVREAGTLSGLTVLEVGPGPGGLTRAILETPAPRVIAIERDTRCAAALAPLVSAAQGRLQLITADALTLDFATLSPPPRAIIANLPYNIGTELLAGWMEKAHAFTQLTLMFQDEVAARIVAAPGSKAYGRLSVLCQYACSARRLFGVPARAFTPPPKVSSAIVHLVPRAGTDLSLLPFLSRVTGAAFGQRRKMLRQSLKELFSESEMHALGVDSQARAEDLTVAQFQQLAAAHQAKAGQSKPAG